MKLYRPYLPVKVRLAVAERQFREKFPAGFPVNGTGGKRLAGLLGALFGETPYQLHHRPALCNRRRSARRGVVVYDPPANDPAHLVYLAKDAHGIETRVRGVGALRSDLGQLRYNKRVARNRAAKPRNKKRAKRNRAMFRMLGSIAKMPVPKLREFLGDLNTYMKLASLSSAKLRRPKRKWPKRPLRSRGFR